MYLLTFHTCILIFSLLFLFQRYYTSFCNHTCKRTTWAGKALRLLGRQGCVDRALGPERPRHPAMQPTAPESSAAGGSVWNPAPASGQHGLHTDTPTRPVPVGGIHEGNRSVNISKYKWRKNKKILGLREQWLAAHNSNRKLQKSLINNWASHTHKNTHTNHIFYKKNTQKWTLEWLGPLNSHISKVTNLDISKVNTVKVREHLVDLGRVLEDSAGCLGKVVQTCVATQCLGKSIGWCHLRDKIERKLKFASD